MWTYKYTDELYHWKYLKKEKKNGKWRYYYDMESLKKDAITKIDETFNDPTNIYDVNFMNYERKINDVKKSEEWQDIVKREDPEYVRVNEDGTKTYLLDDYLVKKKHPELDVVDDLINGRQVTVNKVDKKSFIAGMKDYISIGMAVAAGITTGLKTLFKAYQGSYNEDIENVKNTAKNVATTANAAANSTAGKAYTQYNTYKKTASAYTSADYKQTASTIVQAAQESPEIKRLVNNGSVYVTDALRRYNY